MQILPRYPQFPVGVTSPGSSHYSSFNPRMQRRFSHGVSLLGNFMQSTMIDQTTWLNDTDPPPERRISPFFRPRRVSIAATYELPVGRGRAVAIRSRLLDGIVGGWRVAGTYQFAVPHPDVLHVVL